MKGDEEEAETCAECGGTPPCDDCDECGMAECACTCDEDEDEEEEDEE